MKTMTDVRRIVDLYELYGSCKKGARELSISLNTAKKYLRRVNDHRYSIKRLQDFAFSDLSIVEIMI